MNAAAHELVICATCLRCRHLGVIDAEKLAHHGLAAEVMLAELSRMVVCEACGSHAVRLERKTPAEARSFIEG